MACTEVQKVQVGTRMFSEEAEDLWDSACKRLEVVGVDITWVAFQVHFLRRYFPEYVISKKEIEFLELKQGNMIDVEYVAKFEEFVKFCPHYNGATVEGLKCIKFERGLRPKIK